MQGHILVPRGELLPASLASHMSKSPSPHCASIHLLVHVPGEAVDAGPSACVPDTHDGNADKVPSS